MKKYLLCVSVLCGIMLLGCVQSSKSTNRLTSHDIDEALVGNDRDKNGCVLSAGYTWSVLLEKCVRLFEEATMLKNAKDAKATSVAFVLFDTKASKRVELFLPQQNSSIILTQAPSSADKAMIETQWSNATYTLTALNSPKAPHKAKSYTLMHKNELIYKK